MWLITNFGFFSVVQKYQDVAAGTLTIRARVRSDLVTLRERYLPSLGEIVEGGGTDYAFRARAGREATADALLKATVDIGYDNFKNSVSKAMGQKRASVYHNVWSDLYALQTGDFELPPAKSAANGATKSAKATRTGRRAAYGGVLFNEAGQVLLLAPTGGFDGTAWTWPKGKVDPGETPEETALREVLEETGYAATIIGNIPGAWEGSTSTTEYFLMNPKGPQGQFHDETVSTKWVDPAEAPKFIKESTKANAKQRDLEVLTAAIAAHAELTP